MKIILTCALRKDSPAAQFIYHETMYLWSELEYKASAHLSRFVYYARKWCPKGNEVLALFGGSRKYEIKQCLHS